MTSKARIKFFDDEEYVKTFDAFLVVAQAATFPLMSLLQERQVCVCTTIWGATGRPHAGRSKSRLRVKQLIQYFDDVDVDDYSRLVAEEALTRARSALFRRRPDLSRAGRNAAVPGDEEAQVVLDRLAFIKEVADRLHSDMATLVLEARSSGASWARLGIALKESPQTAFNRYRHLEQPRTARPGKRTRRRSATA